MKLLRFNDDRLGLLDGDQVIDITDHVEEHPDGRIQAAILHTQTRPLPGLDELTGAPRLPLNQVALQCVLPTPPKVIAAPVNYLNHQAEMAYEHTVADLGIFLKARTSVIGHGDTIRLPYTDQRFDQEGELAVIIGRQVSNISVDDAMGAVFGYTCLLDMSMRSTEDRSTRKSFDTFTPIGPWVVTADDIPDPAQLRMQCWVNGTLRQDTSIADLIFDVPTLVAYSSSIMTLEPGDIIATGTPAGVGVVGHGDTVTVEISRIGRLEVDVSTTGAIAYQDRPGAAWHPSATVNA